MDNEQIVAALVAKFGDKVRGLTLQPPQAAVSVERSILIEFMRFLREDDSLKFDYLSSLSAVDFLDQGMELVYHINSCEKHHKLTVKVALDRSRPEVATISEIFPAADWYEREAWELFGINVLGHPKLEPLLLPEGWDQGWPMRRDWSGGKDFVTMPEL